MITRKINKLGFCLKYTIIIHNCIITTSLTKLITECICGAVSIIKVKCLSYNLTVTHQGRNQDLFRWTHNFPNSVENNCHSPPPPPPPSPSKTVAIQGQSHMTDEGSFARTSKGIGSMFPQKLLKPRGSEMLFSALFMRHFYKNLI